MHKYEKQKVSCGGTDAQGISGSIHTRHLVCMFVVAVQLDVGRCTQCSPSNDCQKKNNNT
jgi:hypothetical protein